MNQSLEDGISALIHGFESFLAECAILENDEISDYLSDDYEIIEVFDDLNESIAKLLKPIVPLILDSKFEFSGVPEIARLNDFENFAGYIKQDESKFPNIYKWSWNFVQWDTTYWDPLNWAIRETLHEQPEEEIKSRRVFEVYFQGFVRISEATKYGWSSGYEFELLKTLEVLRNSIFATAQEIEEIETLENEIKHAYNHLPLEEIDWDFQGPTRHLEREVWDSIRGQLFGLFDDRDFDLFEEKEEAERSSQDQHNFEGLILKWTSRPNYYLSEIQDKYWKIVEGDYPITLNQGEKKLEVVVPIVYQLFHRFPVGELVEQNIVEEPQDFWRASLVRVGTRDEYSEAENLEMLAIISVALASELNCGLEKISSEIDWLRIQEKEAPLADKPEMEIRLYSQDYFDKNSL